MDVKRIVVHPRLYMTIKGKVTHVPKGMELTLSKEEAERKGAKLADPAKLGKLDVKTGETSQEGDRVAGLEAELAKVKTDAGNALAEMAKQLEAAKKPAKK